MTVFSGGRSSKILSQVKVAIPQEAITKISCIQSQTQVKVFHLLTKLYSLCRNGPYQCFSITIYYLELIVLVYSCMLCFTSRFRFS